MTSLRMRVVEAGVRAVDPFMVHPLEAHDAAEAALDAMLDVLAENADEWAEETRVPLVVGGDALALIAVLREDR